MKASERLVAARKFLDDPQRWTTGVFCRDASGDPVHWHEADRVASCCVYGALLVQLNQLEEGVGTPGDHIEACMLICDAIPCERGEVFKWNDTHTHTEVLAIIDRAIELARSRE